MTMVERMARVIAREDGFEYDITAEANRAIYRCMALAVLRELREPTEVMLRAANQPARVGYTDFAEQLKDAVDAEIAEHEGK